MGKQCTGKPDTYRGAAIALMWAGKEASSLAPWPISRADNKGSHSSYCQVAGKMPEIWEKEEHQSRYVCVVCKRIQGQT